MLIIRWCIPCGTKTKFNSNPLWYRKQESGAGHYKPQRNETAQLSSLTSCIRNTLEGLGISRENGSQQLWNFTLDGVSSQVIVQFTSNTTKERENYFSSKEHVSLSSQEYRDVLCGDARCHISLGGLSCVYFRVCFLLPQ